MPRRPPPTEEKPSGDTDQDKEEQTSQQAPITSSNFKIRLVDPFVLPILTAFSYQDTLKI
jgi:hypothetical protein